MVEHIDGTPEVENIINLSWWRTSMEHIYGYGIQVDNLEKETLKNLELEVKVVIFDSQK